MQKVSEAVTLPPATSLDDDPIEEALITLVSSDNVNFHLTQTQAAISQFMEAVFADAEATRLNLPLVASRELGLIVSYMIRHNGVEPEAISSPLKSKHMHQLVSDLWDADFINHVDDLNALVIAANYLAIPVLTKLVCAKIATNIKGESVETLRRQLGIC